MANQSDLAKLAQNARTQQAQVLLPGVPKLSVLAPKLAQIDPKGCQAFDEAFVQWIRNSNFVLQGQPAS